MAWNDARALDRSAKKSEREELEASDLRTRCPTLWLLIFFVVWWAAVGWEGLDGMDVAGRR